MAFRGSPKRTPSNSLQVATSGTQRTLAPDIISNKHLLACDRIFRIANTWAMHGKGTSIAQASSYSPCRCSRLDGPCPNE